ncbi:hypothetical protein BEP19_07030 [Ammoniphilus oxalaticus]|uniref:DhaL domain-containing protein n=2 Tax=Ammoniphilus oxalaticus TaxID=66863 RepID=A0A419SKZ6_9BACL|nr:DAK2 domain-containing protein [Ammoniphilus oxalaticus]RKD24681.1 hypothetical protein BEP19_07030 [Ammoniphilus oxalaticus]
MFFAGAKALANHASEVDALNVFPVPDGDTGTNMNLSMSSGVSELKKNPSHHAGMVSQVLSKGLLMGARGNSGVILSQLFRGFSKAIADDETVTAKTLALAFSQGVTMAYDAVMKPVEGTILTVAKDAAAGAQQAAQRTDDITQVMRVTLQAAQESLARTPQLLPVLKEVGVVDSGGQGLVYIYIGFYQALLGEVGDEQLLDQLNELVAQQPREEMTSLRFQEERAQIHLQTESIEYGYCTEFLIKRAPSPRFQLAPFRERVSHFGDSLLVVADEEWVKVHIHSEHPGKVLEYGQQFGELVGIKIENMREQHAQIVSIENHERTNNLDPQQEERQAMQAYGIVAAASGEGIVEILKSLGVDEVVEGGQTMNPSTEDLLQAASQLQAEHIIFLPNNKNIIMAAEQAARMIELPATVVPSRSMPQGIAALLSLKIEESPGVNKQQMIDAISHVKTGLVTYAVRDSKVDQLQIKEGDFIGLLEDEIVTAATTLNQVSKDLLTEMIDEESEVVSIFYGQEVETNEAEAFADEIQSAYPQLEVELYTGGQPLYSFIFSVE